MVVQVTRSTIGMAFFAALASAPVGAQQYSRRAETSDIPKSAYPPAGLCRVWLKDVAASQQPAATDCNSAIRNHPANAKVLFGDMPGVPAATRSAPPASGFDGMHNSWSEVRRQGGARVRMVPPSAGGAPGTVAPSAATVTTAPASARILTKTVVPVTPPQPAKPAAKPE
jgi:hypothetical protein